MKISARWGLALIVFIALILLVLYSKRKKFGNFATILPPRGYKVTISPPRSAAHTWLTFNGTSLILPLNICNKWNREFVLDTGSARVVALDQKPCVPVNQKRTILNYGSMQVSAAKSSNSVPIQVGNLKVWMEIPTIFFVDQCTRGRCANILGLMPRESGGTFPYHSFSIIFDGVGGGWFSIFPNPPHHAIRLPYTILKGFYTLENVHVVNRKTGKSLRRNAVVDSGTTLVEFPPQMNISQPLDIYAADGKTLLVSLSTNDMRTSSSVGKAFPDETFVLGLPFFKKKHVAFNGEDKHISFWK